jgi:hypothetical protein
MKDKSQDRGSGFVLKNPDEGQITGQRKQICPKLFTLKTKL